MNPGSSKRFNDVTPEAFYMNFFKHALDIYVLKVNEEEKVLLEGKCSQCGAAASQYCKTCLAPYCSRNCRCEDCPKHKLACGIKVKPGLVPSSSTSFEDLRITEKVSGSRSELRGTRESVERELSSDEKTTIEAKVHTDCSEANNPQKHVMKKKSTGRGRNTCSSKQTQRNNGRENFASDNRTGSVTELNKTKITGKKSRRLRYNKTETIFKVGEKIKVEALSKLAEDEFWVRECRNKKKFEEVQRTLSREAENYLSESPRLGKMCAYQHKKEWYRGKVIYVSSSVVRILLIDIGEKVVTTPSTIKVLPFDLEEIRDMAFRIKLIDSAPEVADNLSEFTLEVVEQNSDRTFLVRPLQGPSSDLLHASNVAVSQKQCDIVDNRSEAKYDDDSRRHIFGLLEPGLVGVFMVTQCHPSDPCILYGSLELESLEETVQVAKKLAMLTCLPGDKLSSAKIGDFVIAQYLWNQGARGIVVSKTGKFTLKLVDRGHELTVDDIYRIPPSAVGLMEMGCKLTLTKEMKQLERFTPITLKFLKPLELGKWHCELQLDEASDGEYVGIIEVEEGSDSLSVECGSEEYVPFESGCRVVISATDETGIYVRRLDCGWKAKFDKLCHDLNKAHKLEQIQEPVLRPGLMLRCMSTVDNKWYRARVQSHSKNQLIVQFVDLGTTEVCNLRNSTILPLRFISEPFHAFRVTLAGGRGEISEIGNEYIADLVKERKELIMRFEDLSKGVILREESDAVDVNEYGYGGGGDASAVFRAASTRKSVYREKMFPGAPPISFGPVKSFVILHVDEDDFMKNGHFWGTLGSTMVAYSRFDDKIMEYYKSCSLLEYEPAPGEPCLAEYQGRWFRGVSEKRVENGFHIFYVDFGNSSVVQSKGIRPINDELLEMSTVAYKCVLNGFKSLSAKERRSCFNYLSRLPNESVVVTRCERGLHYIDYIPPCLNEEDWLVKT